MYCSSFARVQTKASIAHLQTMHIWKQCLLLAAFRLVHPLLPMHLKRWAVVFPLPQASGAYQDTTTLKHSSLQHILTQWVTSWTDPVDTKLLHCVLYNDKGRVHLQVRTIFAVSFSLPVTAAW